MIGAKPRSVEAFSNTPFFKNSFPPQKRFLNSVRNGGGSIVLQRLGGSIALQRLGGCLLVV
jgi:hypothetical protein